MNEELLMQEQLTMKGCYVHNTENHNQNLNRTHSVSCYTARNIHKDVTSESA